MTQILLDPPGSYNIAVLLSAHSTTFNSCPKLDGISTKIIFNDKPIVGDIDILQFVRVEIWQVLVVSVEYRSTEIPLEINRISFHFL